MGCMRPPGGMHSRANHKNALSPLRNSKLSGICFEKSAAKPEFLSSFDDAWDNVSVSRVCDARHVLKYKRIGLCLGHQPHELPNEVTTAIRPCNLNRRGFLS